MSLRTHHQAAPPTSGMFGKTRELEQLKQQHHQRVAELERHIKTRDDKIRSLEDELSKLERSMEEFTMQKTTQIKNERAAQEDRRQQEARRQQAQAVRNAEAAAKAQTLAQFRADMVKTYQDQVDKYKHMPNTDVLDLWRIEMEQLAKALAKEFGMLLEYVMYKDRPMSSNPFLLKQDKERNMKYNILKDNLDAWTTLLNNPGRGPVVLKDTGA